MSRKIWHDEDPEGFPLAWTVRGALWRVTASILAPVAWFSVMLLYFGFFAHGLSLAQEIIVGVVSGLALLAALTLLWVSFGVRAYHRWVDG